MHGDAEADPVAEAGSPLDGLDASLPRTAMSGWLAVAAVAVLVAAAVVWAVAARAPTEVEGPGLIIPPDGIYEVGLDTDGTVVDVSVGMGDHVDRGQPVATLRRADGSTVEVTSQVDGIVLAVLVREGSTSPHGTPVVTVQPDHTVSVAVVFMPANAGKPVRPGMTARVAPATAPSSQYGEIRGVVERVSPSVVDRRRIALIVSNNDSLVDSFLESGPVLEVQIRLELADTPSGYAWTIGDGPDFPITDGTLATGSAVIEEHAPWQWSFG